MHLIKKKYVLFGQVYLRVILLDTRVRKRVSTRVLRRVVHIIRFETLGETLGEREKSHQDSSQVGFSELKETADNRANIGGTIIGAPIVGQQLAQYILTDHHDADCKPMIRLILSRQL